MVKAAKRKKKDAETDFAFPKFDETEYMRKEVEGAKAAFVTMGLAIPVAMLLFVLTLSGVPVVAFFVGLGLTVALPKLFAYLPWPKIDTEGFERRDWFGHGATFFFTWFAVWILLLNVPFVDIAPPSIAAVTVNGQEIPLDFGGQTQVPGSNLTIEAHVLENAGVGSVVFTVDGTDYVVSPSPDRPSLYVLQLDASPGVYDIAIRVRDTAGLEASLAFEVNLTGG